MNFSPFHVSSPGLVQGDQVGSSLTAAAWDYWGFWDRAEAKSYHQDTVALLVLSSKRLEQNFSQFRAKNELLV